MSNMKRRWLSGVLAAGLVLAGCASPDERASKLLAEANAAVEAAQAAEAASFEEAYQHYKLAVDKLEAIRTDYAATKAGALIADPGAKVGPFTAANLKAVVLPQFQAKAAAEAEPLACAIELARGETDPYRQGLFYARIAQAYAERKDDAQLDRAIASVEEAARQVVGMYSEADVHEALVAAIAEAKRPERAEGLLEKYRFPMLYSQAPQDVAQAWAHSGDVMKARALLKRIDDPDGKAAVLQAVAMAFAKQGQPAAALAAFKEATAHTSVDRGNSLESNSRWKLGFIVAAAALHDGVKTRQWMEGAHFAAYATADQVEQVVEDIRATGDSATALRAITEDLGLLDLYTPGGDPQLDEVGKVMLLGNVALAQIKLNAADKGLFNLKRAAELTERPFVQSEEATSETLGTQQIRRGFSLLILANDLAKAGQATESKAALQRVVELAETSSDWHYPSSDYDSKHYLIGQAALTYAELDDWPRAIDALKRAGRSEFIVDDLLALDHKRTERRAAASSAPIPDIRPLLHALLTAK